MSNRKTGISETLFILFFYVRIKSFAFYYYYTTYYYVLVFGFLCKSFPRSVVLIFYEFTTAYEHESLAINTKRLSRFMCTLRENQLSSVNLQTAVSEVKFTMEI